MDLDKINQLASQAGYTNFDGDGGPRYTGYNDDMVSFDGNAVDFASSMNTGREYTLTITNGTAVAKNMIISPSFFPGVLGADDHIVADGVIVANLSAVGSPAPIAQFLAWININPTMVVTTRIQSTISAQLQQSLVIQRMSIFKVLETERINVGSSVSEMSPNDKLVTVNRPFQLDNQTKISIIVPAGAVTTFTFYCGAVLNNAAALHTKYKNAKNTATAAK